LDQLGFDVAALRQLTHDNLVAKQAVADAQATSLATSACYITTCLHAEKVERALEHATITLDLRQGQANSPDIADFATEVVQDPSDYLFLGGVYTINHTQPVCHTGKFPPPSALPPTPTVPMQTTSIDKTHGVGIQCGRPYFNKPPKCVPPPRTTHIPHARRVDMSSLLYVIRIMSSAKVISFRWSPLKIKP
jgi:hypothetical protein